MIAQYFTIYCVFPSYTYILASFSNKKRHLLTISQLRHKVMANLCRGALCREVMTCESREMLGRMIIIDPMTGISRKLPWQTAHHPFYLKTLLTFNLPPTYTVYINIYSITVKGLRLCQNGIKPNSSLSLSYGLQNLVLSTDLCSRCS